MKMKLLFVMLALVVTLGLSFSMTACKDGGSGASGDKSVSDSAISSGEIDDEGTVEEEEELVDSGEPTAVTGEWKLTSAKVDGKKLGEAELGALNYSFTFHNSIADVTVKGETYKSIEYVFESDEVMFETERLESVTPKLEKGKLVWVDSSEFPEITLYFEKK